MIRTKFGYFTVYIMKSANGDDVQPLKWGQSNETLQLCFTHQTD